jgi:serine beta-lactamase-like protein LACTB, mitochondrial
MRTALFLLLAFLAAPHAAAQPARPDAGALAARIDAEVNTQRLVGLSIALVRDGRIIHTEHRGWEDRERQIPAGDDTMYRWASISKPLTAVVAMQLWEKGRLDLDREVWDLVPEFPRLPQPITCRQLLCHQSGIVHYTNGKVIKTPRPDLDGRYLSIIDALDTFKASPLVCSPGEKYSYTTHGYILAGAVVERAAAGPVYPQLVRENIILPLGMTTLRPDYQWEDIPGRAVGYRPGRTGEDGARPMVISTDTDVSWKLAGGGWISNISDLALFGAGMLEHKLVRPETRDLMWTAQPTLDGSPTRYGLGFQIASFGGRPLISHGGSQEKSRTLLIMSPSAGAAVALMSNTESANLMPLARDLLSLLTGPEAESPEGAAP